MGRGETWSGVDKQRLTALVAEHTDGDGRVSGWAEIAQAFEGRGARACLQKWDNISGKGSEQIGKATFSPEVLKRLCAEFVIERDPTDEEIRIFVGKLLAECEDTTRVNFETLKTWFYNKRYFDPITWGDAAKAVDEFNAECEPGDTIVRIYKDVELDVTGGYKGVHVSKYGYIAEVPFAGRRAVFGHPSQLECALWRALMMLRKNGLAENWHETLLEELIANKKALKKEKQEKKEKKETKETKETKRKLAESVDDDDELVEVPARRKPRVANDAH